MKKRVVAAILAAAMAVSLTACGGGSDKKEPAKGGEGGSKEAKVTAIMTTDPDTLDPGRADDSQEESDCIGISGNTASFDRRKINRSRSRKL